MSYECDNCENNVEFYTWREVCELFLRLDLGSEEWLEMVEAILEKVNNNGHTYKLVEETE